MVFEHGERPAKAPFFLMVGHKGLFFYCRCNGNITYIITEFTKTASISIIICKELRWY